METVDGSLLKWFWNPLNPVKCLDPKNEGLGRAAATGRSRARSIPRVLAPRRDLSMLVLGKTVSEKLRCVVECGDIK